MVAHSAQRLVLIRKIDQPDTRNNSIERIGRYGAQHFAVGDDGLDVAIARQFRVASGEIKNSGRNVGGEHITLRANAPRRGQCLLPRTGGDIENTTAALYIGHIQHQFGRRSKPPGQEWTPAVPCFGRVVPLLAGRFLEFDRVESRLLLIHGRLLAHEPETRRLPEDSIVLQETILGA